MDETSFRPRVLNLSHPPISLRVWSPLPVAALEREALVVGGLRLREAQVAAAAQHALRVDIPAGFVQETACNIIE